MKILFMTMLYTTKFDTTWWWLLLILLLVQMEQVCVVIAFQPQLLRHPSALRHPTRVHNDHDKHQQCIFTHRFNFRFFLSPRPFGETVLGFSRGGVKLNDAITFSFSVSTSSTSSKSDGKTNSSTHGM